eukprot:Gb_37368 [translate_table: standard]
MPKKISTSSSHEVIFLTKDLWRSTLEQLSTVEIAQATDMCCMWSSITPKSRVQINTFKVPWGSRTISNESSSRNLWWDSISERFTILLKQFLENLTKENNASEEDLPKEELEDSSMRINEQLIKIRLLTAQGFLRKSQFNIPHEVALRCLAYLPSFTRAIARCLSRAWRDALHPHSIHPICQYLKLPNENWLLISMILARSSNNVRHYRWPNFVGANCNGYIHSLIAIVDNTQYAPKHHSALLDVFASPKIGHPLQFWRNQPVAGIAWTNLNREVCSYRLYSRVKLSMIITFGNRRGVESMAPLAIQNNAPVVNIHKLTLMSRRYGNPYLRQ